MSSLYWLASYPKSGNTWFRSFLQNLLENGDKPVDINALKTGSIASARSWLDDCLGFDSADLSADEIDRLRPAVYDWDKDTVELGYHKIHDAYTFPVAGEPLVGVHGTKGALYIVRNPLDVAPSCANHFQCSLDQAIAYMGDSKFSLLNHPNRLKLQVRQHLLSWSDHVASWLDAANLKRLVIRYEDMHANPLATFTQACQFLELPTDPVRIKQAIAFSDFKELSRQEQEKGFKERPAKASLFFRQGQSGDWQNKLSAEQIVQIIADHGPMMRRLGYLDEHGHALVTPQPVAESLLLNNDDKRSILLETQHFLLRPICDVDVNDDYISWFNDAAIQQGLNHVPRGWQREQTLRHLRQFNYKDSFHLGIFRKSGILVGFVTVQRLSTASAEFTLVIGDKSLWGKGVPDDVLPVLFDHFFADGNIERFYGQVIATHHRLNAMMTRLGFELEYRQNEGKNISTGEPMRLNHYILHRQNWQHRK
ncbi:GNAT family N-acetyltransferase [Celerinatantimonas yamalensis]|uniref:GNAT family N-acetyltransferase n=1 Tax=Celerinatantimonas yamalensis TaxID=559956 RepID=A0ABW9G8B8_9GAMM